MKSTKNKWLGRLVNEHIGRKSGREGNEFINNNDISDKIIKLP